MASALLEAVRGLRVADPGLVIKPLLARLREQQPGLGAGTKEVREALAALKAESEAKAASAAAATAAALHAADQGSAPAHAAPSLACVGCARMPSEMGDGRLKHPVCPKCVTLKMPTTYFCSVNCPGNPVAWNTHVVYHKDLKKQEKAIEDGGARQQRAREAAERQARMRRLARDYYTVHATARRTVEGRPSVRYWLCSVASPRRRRAQLAAVAAAGGALGALREPAAQALGVAAVAAALAPHVPASASIGYTVHK